MFAAAPGYGGSIKCGKMVAPGISVQLMVIYLPVFALLEAGLEGYVDKRTG